MAKKQLNVNVNQSFKQTVANQVIKKKSDFPQLLMKDKFDFTI